MEYTIEDYYKKMKALSEEVSQLHRMVAERDAQIRYLTRELDRYRCEPMMHLGRDHCE